MAILVTGGAGYIGSHTCLELLSEGYEVVVLDNLVSANRESLHRVAELAGRPLHFYESDLLHKEAVRQVFREHHIDAVIHFAGLKSVTESIFRPMEYYHNNLGGTLNLCEVMKENRVEKLVFSSSAAVYGTPSVVPVTENSPRGEIISPYGRTKAMLEEMLRDIHTSSPQCSIIMLRYFNPIGAHESGRIGEDPRGIPGNLLPFVTQVAIGRFPFLSIFGKDYDTPDGTCIRDFIHVMDLARGHIFALRKILQEEGMMEVYNLGTGRGSSVLELVHAFETVNGIPIRCEFRPRRPGDVPVCYADVSKAAHDLGWKAERGLQDMCRDAWRWQKQNPSGYQM